MSEHVPVVNEFTAWEAVLYVPYHAEGNRVHPDCERGIVTSFNDMYVFVRFGNHLNSQACKRDQLQRIDE